jgi:hypothetical protein
MKNLTFQLTKKEHSRLKKQLLAIGLLPDSNEQAVISWFARLCLTAHLKRKDPTNIAV